MILLLDIGNSNTHFGLGDARRVVRNAEIPTTSWAAQTAKAKFKKFVGNARLEGAILCSVVPKATASALKMIKGLWNLHGLELTPKTLRCVGIDYPRPDTIGPDRLANAVAVRVHFGAPSVVIDFGTAVTVDVVNREGNFAGGIIAPGLAAMTEYLHEKTALLPKIRIRETRSVIGKSTKEAMNIGAVHGYPGLIRALVQNVKQELAIRRLPIVATGGYARLVARKLPEITQVQPLLTLEGIRLVWHAHHQARK